MRLSHISWNLAGLTIPLVTAAFTVPSLVTKLGQERFGMLALAWGLIGYAGALDLGIGRALTQKVGVLLGKNDAKSVPAVMATASRITLITGVIGFLTIAIAGWFSSSLWIKNGEIAKSEVQISILLLAVALPAQAMSATYKGINEAYLNFKWISILRAFLGALNFGAPYLICFYSVQLPLIVGSLVLSRIVALTAYKELALSCLQNRDKNLYRYSPAVARSLFSFGGWLTLSSIVSPVLVQADRFAIASILSAAAVYVYVLPYEVVVQSLILVGAVSSVIFPNLARLIHENPQASNEYFKKWLIKVVFFMAAICLMICMMLPLFLPLWIKSDLNPNSVVVGQILCLGVFANSIGSMYYAFLHAKGRADVTAKIHIFELPFFIAALVFLIDRFGVQGAAWAWVGRMILDCIVLAVMSSRIKVGSI